MKSTLALLHLCVRFVLVFIVWLIGMIPLASAREGAWVHETFEDFSGGEFDAAGQNIYVTREGDIEAIRRYDLNQDGWLDLVFQGTHDWTFDYPATVGRVVDGKVLETCSLGIKGSYRVVLNDLNRDGYIDAVFCPNDNWVSGRRFLSIAWGGPDGWSPSCINGVLPVQDARQLTVGDFDGDGWSDIAVLCRAAWLPSQPEGNITRIYWGGEQGYLVSRRTDIGVVDAIDLKAIAQSGIPYSLALLTSHGTVEIHSGFTSETPSPTERISTIQLPDKAAITLAVADMDLDGRGDLLIGTREDRLYVVPCVADNSWGDIESIPAKPASAISTDDLDGDGRTDLVLSYYESPLIGDPVPLSEGDGKVSILWGDDEGFSAQSLSLPDLEWISASAVGDLNDDGRPDMVFVRNRTDQKSLFAKVVVLINDGDQRFTQIESELPTIGAADVAIAPAEGDGQARIVVANAIGTSRVDEKVDSYIYWGSNEGFTTDNRQVISETSGFQTVAADLNADGYVDLVAPYFGHGVDEEIVNPYRGVNIFWGSPDGFDFEQGRTVLPEYGVLFTNVADLNKDGWLDIVVGQHYTPKNKASPDLIVYYGGQNGFSVERRVAFPSPGRSVPVIIADMNNDDWLDLVVGSRLHQENKIRIFHGGPDGFSSEKQEIIPFFKALDVEVADLNEDGHLDIIASVRSDATPPHTDLGTWILWGGNGSYSQANAQWLPGSAILGITVADFDGDSYLDMLFPSYHGGYSRDSLQHFLYWGGPDGYSVQRRTEFIANASSDAFAADFNQDGLLDFCLVVHTSNDGHYQSSKIFFNDGQRFEQPEVQDLPAIGPHWMWGFDMGHIKHRRQEQNYTSSDLSWTSTMSSGSLDFEADIPKDASLVFEIRSAPSATELNEAAWRSVTKGDFSLSPSDRALQYRVSFNSSNGDAYPTLHRVEIDLQP